MWLRLIRGIIQFASILVLCCIYIYIHMYIYIYTLYAMNIVELEPN